LPRPEGSGPGYRRPVLVVQADAFNRSRIGTVIAVAITSNLALAEAPGNVRLSRRASGLPKQSVANVSQVLTLDRTLLTKRIRRVSREAMSAVDVGLRLALQL
jgi:mRNA interferase MazF